MTRQVIQPNKKCTFNELHILFGGLKEGHYVCYAVCNVMKYNYNKINFRIDWGEIWPILGLFGPQNQTKQSIIVLYLINT